MPPTCAPHAPAFCAPHATPLTPLALLLAALLAPPAPAWAARPSQATAKQARSAASAAAHPAPGQDTLLAHCPAGLAVPLCWQRLRALETTRLQGRQLLRRDGPVLHMGPGAQFTDAADGSRLHLYEGRVARGTHHLVTQRSPTAPDTVLAVWLVQPSTGRQQPLAGPPHLATEQRLLLAMPHDGHSLVLLQRSGEGPEERWRQQFRFDPPPGLALAWQRWRQDGLAAHLQWRWQGPSARCQQQGRTQLREGPYGWELFPAPPSPPKECRGWNPTPPDTAPSLPEPTPSPAPAPAPTPVPTPPAYSSSSSSSG